MVPVRAQKRMEALHEPPLSRPSATLSPPGGERAGRGVPIWFMVPMHAKNERGLSMNRRFVLLLVLVLVLDPPSWFRGRARERCFPFPHSLTLPCPAPTFALD